VDTAWLGWIVAILSGGGLAALLLYRQNKQKLNTESLLLGAQAENTETGTLISIIGILRGEIDRLSARLMMLAERVTALEEDNRGLKRTVSKLLDLVRRMWAVIRDNDLDIDADLAGDIYEAIEDAA